MSFYIGGDTQEFEFDFFTKTANSVADCPMKIYKGEVDPDALPSPTDTLWKEITSQNIIDKLKEQNEITTSNLATDRSTIQWGDKTLTKTNVIKIVDDFKGKIKGSVVENPNKVYSCITDSLKTPTDITGDWGTGFAESAQENINKISNLDNSCYTVTASADSLSSNIPQQLFSFNLIEIIERKFGAIPRETVAEKIEWIGRNIDKIQYKWHGYGSCPSGNKALLTVFIAKTNSWSGTMTTHNSSTVSQLIRTIYASSVVDIVDNNGFIHFITHTDPSDGTTPSTIYTDYCSIELTLKAPENLITATNTNEDIVVDFSGKVSGNLVENANIYKVASQSSLQIPSSSYFVEGSQFAYDYIETRDGVCSTPNSVLNGYIPQALFSFNIVAAVEKHLGQPIPAVDKVQWCKDNIRMFLCDWYGYGSCPTGNKAYLDYWNGTTWGLLAGNNQELKTNTASTPTNISYFPSNDTIKQNMIGADGMIHFLVYAPASDGVTASTIYTDYVKLTIKLKYIPTYDFYTDSNNRRDAGLTNIVVVKRPIGDMTSDFSGKVAGSVVENPNIFCPNTDYTILKPPSNYTETSDYTNLSTLNGYSRASITNIGETGLPVHCFKFNLIAIAEKQLGTSIPGTDTDSKVQWLKDNLSNIKCEWHGYGSCPSGNKANTAIFRTYWEGAMSGWGGWSNSSSSPTMLQRNFDIQDEYWNKIIQPDGFVYFLAYTDPSDGVTPSAIYTDYIKLTLIFKTDTTGYNYFTNESAEISVTTDNKASAFLIECDLTPIANSLYGGSNSALKGALKSIETNVWAMGSGANGNELGYGVKLMNWQDTQSVYGGYSPTSNTSAIFKLNKTLDTQKDCADTITSENKLYIAVYSTYKSNEVIPSEVNLDYVNIKVKLTRTPDNIPPIPIELGTKWSILIKGFSPSWGNAKPVVIKTRYLSAAKEDNSDAFILYKDNVSRETKIWWKNLSWWPTTIKPDDNREVFQASNILICYENNKLSFYELFNNSILTKNALENVVITSGKYKLYLGTDFSKDFYAYAFLDSVHFFNNKTFTDEEAEILLRGRNTIDTSNEYYNELAEQFKNPIIQTGYILPNNRYVITGQAKLYCNGYYTRTVQDCEFITTEKENKIELIGTAEVTRLD